MEKGGLLDMSINIILALIIPPASVYRQNGVDESFWLCVLLTLMVVIPGQIHALVVTCINWHNRSTGKEVKMTEFEPPVILQPKPQRVVAVTPNYMEDGSEADLRSILISQSPAIGHHKTGPEGVKDTSEIPAPMIDGIGSREKRPEKLVYGN